jgi:hypothetical protein
VQKFEGTAPDIEPRCEAKVNTAKQASAVAPQHRLIRISEASVSSDAIERLNAEQTQ